MCPQRQWEKLVKGSWVRSMSPFDHKLLDVRMAGSSLEILQVSVEEGEQCDGSWDHPCDIDGPFSGNEASPDWSEEFSCNFCVLIYGRLAWDLFSLRYLPRLFHSILAEIGISEDVYNPVSVALLEPSFYTEMRSDCICLSPLYASQKDFLRLLVDETMHVYQVSFPYNELAIFLLLFLVIAGAWLGFWVVRKLVLTEDGLIDIGVSHFVAWSIRMIAAVMILQSSVDPLLAAEVLLCGILVSSMLKRITRSRFIRHWYKMLEAISKSNASHDTSDPLTKAIAIDGSTSCQGYVMKLPPKEVGPTARWIMVVEKSAKGKQEMERIMGIIPGGALGSIKLTLPLHDEIQTPMNLRRTDNKSKRRLQIPDSSTLGDSYDEYLHTIQTPVTYDFPKFQSRPFRMFACNSSVQGLTRTPPSQMLGSETYYSSFHTTPERRNFTRDEWEKFTKDSTKTALEELVSSPDFSKWAVAHADRITLTPSKDATADRRRRWFLWF
ncbi:transmembrane protein [Actinidia rufa]|uniref:Transmembrane protein n=1 Tax=Actinidia rufa TaxID=165716 RepID=A0A7J0FL51_9ERIC|nr:transmembrane protein [Actinidia rufa]